jgi:LacI family transcriptional regulator
MQVTESAKGKKRKNSLPTIYDIAALAGVNPSTVSRALNNPGRINAVTEAKIKDAAKQLNYQVNPFARALPTGRTRMLALIVADITNPMFFDAVRGAEAAASQAGYTLVIAESQESRRLEAATVERIMPSVDGVVLVTSRLEDAEVLEIAGKKSVVLMNRRIEGVADVVTDVSEGIEQALEHLQGLGHASIAYLSGPANSWMSKHRWNLIFQGAVKRGLKVVEIGPNEPVVAGGKAAADLVNASGVTAVMAYNDLIAIGLMGALRDKGAPVPQKMSVIGFDDIFGSDLTTPALTTIKAPLEKAGELAVQALLHEIEDESSLAVTESARNLKSQLVFRSSTAQAK